MKILSLFVIYLVTIMSCNASNQTKILIPAGEFLMGCSSHDPECDTDEGLVAGSKVFVPAFKIDSHEVSVAEFRACVKDKSCQRPYDTHRNKYCNYDNPERDDHPVNCVNWKLASQYCDWKKGRLLLEAEWEKAARAGKNNLRYAWGNQNANCSYAIMDDGLTKTKLHGNETDGCGEDRTWPRASRASNAYGIYDMNGGVAEWVANWYHTEAIEKYYSKNNLHAPANGSRKVIRGGAWDEKAWALSNSGRWAKIPMWHSSIYGSNGIRCGYDVK